MIETIIQAYGPIGFGLVSVIVLWRVIIAPELEMQRQGIQELARIANTTLATAEQCSDATEKAQDIAQLLAATCPRFPGVKQNEDLRRQSEIRAHDARLAT